MLIDFRLTNYRSFHETQTLSMVAVSGKEHETTNLFASGSTVALRLLRSAIVYGPNAGGKTNLVRALQFMQGMVLNSATQIQEGQKLNVQPFLFGTEAHDQPTRFEVNIMEESGEGEIRYQYGFSLTSERVISEWLFAAPKGRAKLIFQREYEPETGKYQWDWGASFVGRKEDLRDKTRANGLFLSTAVLFNNEQLRPVFIWFQNRLAIIPDNALIMLGHTLGMCTTDNDKADIISFFRDADISITGVSLDKQPVKKVTIAFDLVSGAKETKTTEDEAMLVRFRHRSRDGLSELELPLAEESSGTQKLFALAGPWLDVMRKRRVLVVDELDRSLHPLICRHLIGRFNNSRTNPQNAQLIATTHDTSLLDPHLLRRDQVWFIEENRQQASHLYSLVEFSPRKEASLEQDYLRGRYGALPVVGSLDF
jgi:hypothetical protein